MAEIELISWVCIRPDQWDHTKALYHLIYCPRVNQKALIWHKIGFWEALGCLSRLRTFVCGGNELISWVYIRPDQWYHIKALYQLINCPRVNQGPSFDLKLLFGGPFLQLTIKIACLWLAMSSSHEDPTGLIIRVTFQPFSTSFGVPGPKKALIWPNMTLRDALVCLCWPRWFVCHGNWVQLMNIHQDTSGLTIRIMFQPFSTQFGAPGPSKGPHLSWNCP